MQSTGHDVKCGIKWDHFEIIESGITIPNKRFLIKEILFMEYLSPGLNRTTESEKLYFYQNSYLLAGANACNFGHKMIHLVISIRF